MTKEAASKRPAAPPRGAPERNKEPRNKEPRKKQPRQKELRRRRARERSYRHSGAFSWIDVPIIVALGGAWAAFWGLVYVGLGYVIESPYARPLMALALAGLLGAGAGWLCQWLRVRNATFAGAAGLFAGAAGLWAAWTALLAVPVAVLMLMSEEAGPMPMPYSLAESFWPGVVWEFATTTAAPQRAGAFGSLQAVWIAWAMEALLLLALPAMISGRYLKRAVFCEECDAWMKKRVALAPFAPVEDAAAFRDRLESGDFEALLELPEHPVGARACAEVAFVSCGSCEKAGYVTVRNVPLEGTLEEPPEGGEATAGKAREVPAGGETVVELIYIPQAARERAIQALKPKALARLEALQASLGEDAKGEDAKEDEREKPGASEGAKQAKRDAAAKEAAGGESKEGEARA